MKEDITTAFEEKVADMTNEQRFELSSMLNRLTTNSHSQRKSGRKPTKTKFLSVIRAKRRVKNKMQLASRKANRK